MGGGAAAGVAAVAGGAGAGRCVAGRSRRSSRRSCRSSSPPHGRPSTPMETYLRLMFLKFRYRLGYESLVPRGVRLDHLAAVLPDPARRPGAASDDVDEADHPLRHCGGRRAERGAVGQGGRGEGAAHQPVARRHHGGPGERGLPDRLAGCWPRRCAGSRRPVGGSRPPVARSGPRLRDRSRAAGKRAHGIAAKLRMRRRRAATRRRPTVQPDHRGVGRPGRAGRGRCGAAAGQCPPGAAHGARRRPSSAEPRCGGRGGGSAAGPAAPGGR